MGMKEKDTEIINKKNSSVKKLNKNLSYKNE
jgi:hypothetical protein